jgi:hypothetical protein
MADKIEVRIPEVGERLRPDEQMFFDSFNGLIAMASHTLGREITTALALRAATNEMRRNIGPAATRFILFRYADEQAEDGSDGR